MIYLDSLPYAIDALAPIISSETLSFHYGKHLQSYVDNLNKLLPMSGLENLPLEDIVVKAFSSLPAPNSNLTAIYNNAGQILNHNMYFAQFKSAQHLTHSPAPISLPAPSGDLAIQIIKHWGSFTSFMDKFTASGTTLFGSGWVWLAAKNDRSLIITQEHDAGNPITRGLHPLLTFDVWEHAYYLDYQNRRASHLQALWQILDWNVIEYRYHSIH